MYVYHASDTPAVDLPAVDHVMQSAVDHVMPTGGMQLLRIRMYVYLFITLVTTS